MAIKRPNYTQVPNDLLGDLLPGNLVSPGLMAKMSGAELKVFAAICRLTFGYHQSERRASLTMIQQLTGLSRQGVINSSNALQRLDLIEKSTARRLTLWRVKVNSVDQQWSTQLTSIVNSVDQHSQLSRPPSKKETINKLCHDIKENLKMSMTQATFDSQIAFTDMVRQNGHFLIIAPTEQIRDVLENRMRDTLRRSISYVTNEPDPVLKFQVRTYTDD